MATSLDDILMQTGHLGPDYGVASSSAPSCNSISSGSKANGCSSFGRPLKRARPYYPSGEEYDAFENFDSEIPCISSQTAPNPNPTHSFVCETLDVTHSGVTGRRRLHAPRISPEDLTAITDLLRTRGIGFKDEIVTKNSSKLSGSGESAQTGGRHSPYSSSCSFNIPPRRLFACVSESDLYLVTILLRQRWISFNETSKFAVVRKVRLAPPAPICVRMDNVHRHESAMTPNLAEVLKENETVREEKDEDIKMTENENRFEDRPREGEWTADSVSGLFDKANEVKTETEEHHAEDEPMSTSLNAAIAAMLRPESPSRTGFSVHIKESPGDFKFIKNKKSISRVPLSNFPLTECRTLSQLEEVCVDEANTVLTLIDQGYLMNNPPCHRCGAPMRLRNRGDSKEWRCRQIRGKDCSTRSVKKHSFFSRASIPIKTTLKLALMWMNRCSGQMIEKELGLSAKTVVEYRNFLRELCTGKVLSYEKLGGPDRVVQIHECSLQSRRYGREEKSDKETLCVLAGIEVGTNHSFATVLDTRSADNVLAVLEARVHKGSTVLFNPTKSDKQTGDFLLGIVDNQIEINCQQTDNIEEVSALWHRIRDFMQRNGNSMSEMLLPSYLDEFVVREREGDNFYQVIFDSIRAVLERCQASVIAQANEVKEMDNSLETPMSVTEIKEEIASVNIQNDVSPSDIVNDS